MNFSVIRGPLRGCLLRLKHDYHSPNARHSSSTIDPENMKVMTDVKESWWNPDGPIKPLHAMNKIRIPFIREGLINAGAVSPGNQNTPRVLDGLNILDVGCGGGILTESLAKLQGNVTGVEPSKELYEVAKEHADKHTNNLNLKYLNLTVEELISDEKHVNHYDCVVLSEVIEHVNNPSDFLEQCVTALKPGGSLFITTFNKTIPSLVLAIGVAEHVLGLIPKNTHDWDKFIALDDMHKMIEHANCSVLQTVGTMYLPWTNSWKLMRDTDVSYAIHAVKQ